MNLLRKDGGPESRVWGFYFVEWKWLFSIVLLRFENGSREAYHSHAFNAVSWLLRGTLVEHIIEDGSHTVQVYKPSLWPIWTPRERFHKVSSVGRSWALTFRGPWVNFWRESSGGRSYTLTHGRKVVQ